MHAIAQNTQVCANNMQEICKKCANILTALVKYAKKLQ